MFYGFINRHYILLGLVQGGTLIEPIITKHNDLSQVQRHFSSFPLTSHLHNPAFRLVSLNPSLSAIFSFLRVPEIHDGYKYKIFISRMTSVADIIASVVEELGLAKTLPISGAGNLEYVLEEVWADGENERMYFYLPFLCQALTTTVGVSRLPTTTHLFDVIQFPFSANPFKFTATRHFRFCVPDEWYRRSKPRSVSRPAAPSEATIRQLAALQESEGEIDSERDGTAKFDAKVVPSLQDTAKAIEQRGLVTQGRLSSVFESWLRPTSIASQSRPSVSENRKSVSEPKPASESQVIHGKDVTDSSDNETDNSFEEMLVSCTPESHY